VDPGARFGRRREMKASSEWIVLFSLELTSVGLINGTTDTEPHIDITFLGCKEGVEDLIFLVRRQSDASVFDRHLKPPSDHI
jgi:hypothetical protein